MHHKSWLFYGKSNFLLYFYKTHRSNSKKLNILKVFIKNTTKNIDYTEGPLCKQNTPTRD